MTTPDDITPHELLKSTYPIAARCVSSLVELCKVNPSVVEEVIELAIMIGINAAHNRLETDKHNEVVTTIREKLTMPDWSGNKQ